ncbi:MAG: tetratricopeptide repeat protein [bacterium]
MTKQGSQRKYVFSITRSLLKGGLILVFTFLLLCPESSVLVFAKDSGIREDLGNALNYFQNGHFDKALKTFESVIEKDPNTPEALEALFYRAECLFSLQIWPEAIDAYEEIREEDFKHPLKEQINYRIILARFAQKEWTIALDEAERFLTTFPKSTSWTRVIYLKAWALYMCGQYKKAVDFLLGRPEYTSALGLQNIDPWIKAEEAMMSWDYEKSITIFREIIDNQKCGPNGNNYWLEHLRLAECFMKLWKFQQAHKILRLIEKSNADEDLKIYALLEEGEAYLNQGWFAKANETFSSISRSNHYGSYGDRILFLTAQSFLHLKRWKDSGDLFYTLTIKYPESAYLEETEWRIAETSYEQCDFQKAVELLNIFIKNYPNSIFSDKALYILGWSYIYLEEFSNAEDIFKRLLKDHPEGDLSAQTYFAVGRIHFNRGQYESAGDFFLNAEIHAKDKDLIQKAKFFMALRHFYLKDYSQARKGFKEILKEGIDTDNKSALLFLGWTSLAEGRYKEAGSSFRKFLETNPVSFYSEARLPLIWRLAKNAYLLGDYQGTWHWTDLILCEAYETPYHKPAKALRLQCLLDSKDYKEYLEMSDQFLDQNPRLDLNLSQDFAKADILVKKGELRLAAELFKDLSVKYATFDGEIDALFELGMIQKAQGLYKSALRTYAHAIDRCSDSSNKLKIHQAMGEILFKEKAYGFASRHFKKAFSAGANDALRAKTSLFLGLISSIQGQKEIAHHRFMEFFAGSTLDEMSIAEKIDLGLFLEDAAEYSFAIKVFQKVIESETDRKKKAEAQFWIGECYQKMGDLKMAVQEYLLVIKLYPDAGIWGITARFKSAEIYQKTGNLTKALALYRNVERLGKGESYGRFATKRINEIEELVKKKKKGGII